LNNLIDFDRLSQLILRFYINYIILEREEKRKKERERISACLQRFQLDPAFQACIDRT